MECQIRADEVVEVHLKEINYLSCGVLDHGEQVARLRARRVKIIDMGAPTVVLLTKDSTLALPVMEKTANQDFSKAVAGLVGSGQTFYTMLHPSWALPAMLWEKI